MRVLYVTAVVVVAIEYTRYRQSTGFLRKERSITAWSGLGVFCDGCLLELSSVDFLGSS